MSVSFGGKGSTDFVVKGSHKELPQELIDELKAICQVYYHFSLYFIGEKFQWYYKLNLMEQPVGAKLLYLLLLSLLFVAVLIIGLMG